MHKLVSQLVIYRNLPADNLLEPLAEICAEFSAGDYNREELTAEIYEQVHKLLDIGTVYGFDKNLWHNYFHFLVIFHVVGILLIIICKTYTPLG